MILKWYIISIAQSLGHDKQHDNRETLLQKDRIACKIELCLHVNMTLNEKYYNEEQYQGSNKHQEDHFN